MIARTLTSLIKERLGSFPAVATLGPGQSGKTTLAKELDGVYFDLEQKGDGLLLDARWLQRPHGCP